MGGLRTYKEACCAAWSADGECGGWKVRWWRMALKVRFLANNDDTNDLEPLNNTTIARAGNTRVVYSLRPESFLVMYMSICALGLTDAPPRAAHTNAPQLPSPTCTTARDTRPSVHPHGQPDDLADLQASR
ncbi:hypothetical protein J1614_008694 [Plenodomus biglobosus]|nr:hypothetical protein J1614_008694 [Plenodomus biglobosus]